MSLSPLDSSSSPPAAAEVPLAPGFRFHPTDEELVSYYLRRRVLGRRLRVDAIAEVDLYRLEPWDLPSLSRIRSRDAQWYFFARLDRKVAGAGAGGRGGPGNRTNRATPRGYWKTTGKDREVHHRGKPVGMKKTLVFHAGRAPKGGRTNWVMHEYRLLDADGPQDLHVVCRIFQKHGSGPQNGAQYGAPYMEEEWEEDDDAIENGPTSGASAQMAAITCAVDEESNEDDENAYCETNRPARVEPSHLPLVHEMLNPPEMAPLQGQDSKETSDGSCADGAISLEEILQEPLSNISVENIGRLEGQNATDDSINVDDLLSAYPRKDNGYVGQDNAMNGSGPADGDHTSWPLRAYSNQNYVNGPLADEFFDTGNDTNGVAYSGHQQADGFPAPRQVDDSMVFYDAPSDYNLVDGNDDFVYLNDLLNEPLGNESLFDGDDVMAYFDATENDFKYDILGSAQGSNYQLADMPLNFAQKSDNKDKFTFNGISEVPEANAQYGASSSGSHEDLYTDTEFPGVPTDDTADKTYGKRLAGMLGSIPAPPAMASEFPPSTGKSVGMLSAVSSSSIRVTAGIIQLDGLTFSSGSNRWPLQKNGDLSLLVSFAVESDVSSKLPVGLEDATRISTVPMVLRSGFYLLFMSAMILLLSYKVGSCIYSR